ncbi:hypothetical protein HMPREF2678_03800 [Corynebacterium sp. HMSC058E07]|nr:hypothetical protein HMPREF2678_03800 [Corynebacterium sp. HMSC058E07]
MVRQHNQPPHHNNLLSPKSRPLQSLLRPPLLLMKVSIESLRRLSKLTNPSLSKVTRPTKRKVIPQRILSLPMEQRRRALPRKALPLHLKLLSRPSRSRPSHSKLRPSPNRSRPRITVSTMYRPNMT